MKAQPTVGRSSMAMAILLAILLALASTLLGAHRAEAEEAALTLSQTSGLVGSTVTVSGNSFPASSRGSILFGSTKVASFRSDKRGRFSSSFKVPSVPPGTVVVSAAADGVSAGTNFTVLASTSTTTSTTTTSTTTTSTTTTSTTTTTVAPTTTTTQPPPPPTYAVPSSIPADCSVAVSAELNSFVASVPDGSTVQFPSGACYGYDTTLLIQDRRDLTIDGGGSTFRAMTYGAVNRSGWRVQGGSNITLRNMTVYGWNPEGTYHRSDEYQHAYDFRGVAGGTLDNVKGTETLGDGAYVGHDMRLSIFTAPPSRNITIRSAQFSKIGRMGTGYVNVDGALLENSAYDTIALSGIDVEPDIDEQFARNITVRNNTFANVKHAIFTDGGKGGGERRGNITVEGNRQLSTATTCIPPLLVAAPEGQVRSNYTFRNNTANTLSVGVRMTGVYDATIDGNELTWRSAGCGKSEGVELTSVQAAALTNNTFRYFRNLILATLSSYTESGNLLTAL